MLTRDETRLVLSLVSRAVEQAPNGVSPVWLAIQGKLLDMADQAVMGDLVFRLTLPLKQDAGKSATGKERFIEPAATLNRYSSMEPWQQEKARKLVDTLILSERSRWPSWPARGRRRGVVVTRHSSSRPDELSADVLGGKFAVDRLVRAEVLAGDTHKHLVRSAAWVRAKPGAGRLVVDVHELVGEAQQEALL